VNPFCAHTDVGVVSFQTAQLRVENSTLQKKLSAAMQLAKKFEDQSKSLVKKVERLTKEVKGDKKARKPIAAIDECASSQQASSCAMVNSIMDNFKECYESG
jgi:uncharacterized protein YigA (DUF484 family)